MLDSLRVQQIFAEAVELPPAQRDAFVHEACAGDDELRREIESLLASLQEAGKFLFSPTQSSATAMPADEQPGQRIGHYTLLQLLGEGGFGSVFLAEQQQPVRRHVALKILKLGMDTRQVLARFDAERQALAILDHPNIARVLDAGATAAGRPFFVMELVRGLPINQYCDEHHLTPRQRVELMVPVCQAVQHAHQKGIIHRDLKPSNILVTLVDDHPVPKVIDFGVAKATGAQLTNLTLFTEQRQVIGTPAYMSPEQARAGAIDVDTRSDVYSLGVILYELLTGTTPIQNKTLRSAAIEEMQRLIREEEPPKPSTRISTLGEELPSIAALRGVEPARLSRALRGELDWIAMKCLEKDRTRRYESAGSLAADLLRQLADEPVLASPPSKLYRLRKFSRKHRAGIATASVMLLALIAALVISLKSLREVTRQKQAAVESDETAREVNRFLTEMLDAANPDHAKGRVVTVQETLDRAAARIGASFGDKPMVESGIRLTLGGAYGGMGRYDQALENHSRAYELRRQHLGLRSRETLIALSRLANTMFNAGKWKDALPLARQAYDALLQISGPSDKETLIAMQTLCQTLNALGKWNECDPLSVRLIQLHRTSGVRDRALVGALLSRGRMLTEMNRLRDAEPVLREALDLIRSLEGPDDPWAVNALMSLGSVLRQTGRVAEAETMWQEALERSRRVYGPESPFTLMAMNNMGVLLQSQSRHAEAEKIYRDLHDQFVRSLGKESPSSIVALGNLGAALMGQPGRIPDAISVLQEAVDEAEKTVGPDHSITLYLLTDLSMCYSAAQRFDVVVDLNKRIFDAMATAQVSETERADKSEWYGSALCQAKRYSEAEKPLLITLNRCEKAGRAADGIASKVMLRLAEVCDHTSRPAEAQQWKSRAVAATQSASTQSTSAPH